MEQMFRFWLLPMLLLLACVSAEEPNPMAGNYGVGPPAWPTKVYVSAMLDRVLNVDEELYEFDIVIYLFLSWRDPSASAAIEEATRLQNQPTYNNGNGCARLCQHANLPYSNGGQNMKCCDMLWIPGISFRNVITFPEDRMSVWKGVSLSLDGESVVWRNAIRGVFYTTMDYRQFPFDSQVLRILTSLFHERPDYIEFIPSVMSTEMFTVGKGDQLSGWAVGSIKISVTKEHTDEISKYLPNASTENSYPNSTFSLWIYRLDIDTKVIRLSNFFVSNLIAPIVFTTLLGLTVLFIDKKDVGTRIGVVVTLVLALITTQFSINDNLPSSSYLLPTQMLILVSYAFLLIICLESIVVRCIADYPEIAQQHEARQVGRQRLKRLRVVLPILRGMPRDADTEQAKGEAGGTAAGINGADTAAFAILEGAPEERVPSIFPSWVFRKAGNSASTSTHESSHASSYLASHAPGSFFSIRSAFLGSAASQPSEISSGTPSGLRNRKSCVTKFDELSSSQRDTLHHVLLDRSVPPQQSPTPSGPPQQGSADKIGGADLNVLSGASQDWDMAGQLNSGPNESLHSGSTSGTSAVQGVGGDMLGGKVGLVHQLSYPPPHPMAMPGRSSLRCGPAAPNGIAGGGDAAAGRNEEEETDAELEVMLMRLERLRKNFWLEVLHDPAIALHIGQRVDMWTLVILLTLYIIAIALIFSF